MKNLGFACLSLAFVAVISPYILAESDSPRSDCTVLQQWIKANSDRLVKTLPELSVYPQAYRRLIFAALPPTSKSEIWGAQLRAYLDENPNLSGRKKSVVEQAAALADPALFMLASGITETDRMKKIEKLESLVLEVFPQDEAISLFFSIGSANPARLSLRANTSIPLAQGPGPACHCRGTLDCEGSALCVTGGCSRQETGCGFMGTRPCTGLCKILVAPTSK